MDRMVDRARAGMNLLLLATVVMAWSVFGPAPKLVQDAEEIYDIVTSAEIHPAKAEAFLDNVDLSPYTDRLEALRHTKVTLLEGLLEEDLRIMFGLYVSENETQEDVQQRYRKFTDLARDLATIDNQAELRTRLEGLDQVLSSPRERRLVELVRGISRLRREARVSPDATVQELEEKLALRVKLPVLGETIHASSALVAIALGLIGPMLYLMSITITMRVHALKIRKAAGVDWVFFHPGFLGPALGTAWLLAPTLVIILAFYASKLDMVAALSLVLPVGLIGGLCIWTALDA